MAETLNFSFSIDEQTKITLTEKLKQLGMTIAEFVELTLSNFANETQDNLSDLTIQTINNCEKNIDVGYAKNVSDLFKQLNKDF